MMNALLFLVHPKETNIRVFVWAREREDAKRAAQRWLSNGWGGPDNWEVTPLTNDGDRVHLDITLAV